MKNEGKLIAEGKGYIMLSDIVCSAKYPEVKRTAEIEKVREL